MRSNTAILIIHGLAGNINDHEDLANVLELKPNFDVYRFALPGYENFTFCRATKEDWIAAAEKRVKMLIENGYQDIYVIGHSMGAIIACILAEKYHNIKKLVLEAPAFKYNKGLNIKHIGHFGEGYLKSDISRLSLKAVRQFQKLVKENGNIPSKVNIPTLIIQGLEDRLVSPESAKYVYDNLASTHKYLLIIEKMSHAVYNYSKKDQLFVMVREFLDNDTFDADIYLKEFNKKNK